jgi:hypothetical protein
MPSKVPSNSKYNDPLSQLNIQAREFLGEKKKTDTQEEMIPEVRQESVEETPPSASKNENEVTVILTHIQ